MRKKLNDYITVGKAASFLGVSKNTLRRWDAAGKVKTRRDLVTGFRLYLKGELDTILARASKSEATTARPHRERAKR